MYLLIMEALNDEDANYIIEVPINNLLGIINPFEDVIWGSDNSVGIVSIDDVLACPDIEVGTLPASQTEHDIHSRTYNVARIAYLAQSGFTDARFDDHPMTVDVGLFGDTPACVLLDGNHRLAAAVIRREARVQVCVIGDIDKAQRVLIDGEDIWSL